MTNARAIHRLVMYTAVNANETPCRPRHREILWPYEGSETTPGGRGLFHFGSRECLVPTAHARIGVSPATKNPRARRVRVSCRQCGRLHFGLFKGFQGVARCGPTERDRAGESAILSGARRRSSIRNPWCASSTQETRHG